MKIGNIAKIINSKVDGSLLDATTYISTENMLPDCGGVTTASSVPSTKVTAFLRDDILLSNIRPYFKKVFFTRFNGGCSNDVICLRADKTECVPQYLYYLLSTDKFIDRFSASSKGTKMPRGDKNALLSYEFPQRSIDEQLYIVDILGSIDNCIENNQLTCDKLEELARQKYLLRISTSTKKIALETIITIFDSQRIPLSSRERFDRKGNFPYYGATGILDYIDSYLFDGEYVLIAEDGTVIDNDGYPIVQIINDKFWVNNHAHILQGTNGYSNALLYVVLKCLNIQKAVTGAVQLKVNQANLCKLEIPNLNSRTVESLNNEIVPLFQKIQDLKQKNAKLNELKQIYLKKFFG
jgi:restriction modification system DNA specificity domain protein